MHPYPIGYYRVADGDIIQNGDLMLGELRSTCGKVSYGWKQVPLYLVGQEFFENAIELGHPSILLRKLPLDKQ